MKKKLMPLAAFALLLMTCTARAQVSTTHVTGTVYDASGAPAAGVRLTIVKVTRGNVVVSTQRKTVASDAQGHVDFYVLRNSTAYFYGNVVGLDRNEAGVPLAIPDAAEADFASLLPVTAVPSSALLTHAATIASAGQLGHFRVGSGLAIDGSGVLSITAAGVTAHSQLTGLSADDHPQYFNQARGDARYSRLGHTHAIADTTGLQGALDAKAAASDLTAEASARGAADTTLQANIDAEAAARAAAVTSSSAADRARSNHTGTQPLSTISDAGTAATLNVPATGNAAAGEVVKGSDTRLTDARAPLSHTHTSADVTDFAAAVDARGVSANTASRIVARDASGNFSAGTITAALSGNASTATALAANGSNCSAGNAAAGVDASGSAEGCAPLPANTTATTSNFFTAYNATTGAFVKAQPSFGDISGTATAGQIPDLSATYPLLAGKAGGQTISGGTAASENLTLQSTSNSTKGYILLGSGGLVGVNKSTPGAQLHIQSSAAGTKGLIVQMAASPSANPFEVQDSTGAVKASITTSGNINANNSMALLADGTVGRNGGADIFFSTGMTGRSPGDTIFQIDSDNNATNNVFSIRHDSSLSAGGTELMRVDESGVLTVPVVKLGSTSAAPTCNSTNRGTFYVTQGGTGVADTVQLCVKTSSDAYQYVTIVSVP